MLSDEEKKEMLEDAKSESRREDFSQAKNRVSHQAMSWTQYFSFLQGVQNLFPRRNSPKKIQGSAFKL